MGVDISAKNMTAKDAGYRISRRSSEIAFAWKKEKNLIYAWILLLALCVILTIIIGSWAVNIEPAGVKADVGVSVTRLDRDRLEVMIVSLGKDTNIEYLTYYTSRGSGHINRSVNPPAPVRYAGESGIIPVSGYNEQVEIFAVTGDSNTNIFSGKI
ncbi:Uncharacterised protein [uncultured archaeon]|nr:Uncharacterised protein [uncultured archaeon]